MTNRIIKDVETRPALAFLDPIFREWVDRVEQISRFFTQSTETYYVEATLLDLLAGAAWANRAQAITEVKTARFNDGYRKGNGRLDMLMDARGHRIAIEAKLCWGSVLKSEYFEPKFADAREQINSAPGGIADMFLVGVFFVPWWNNVNDQENLQANVVPKYFDIDAAAKACCYDSNLEYPGAMLIVNSAASGDIENL